MADQMARMTERGVFKPIRSMVRALSVSEVMGKSKCVALRATPQVMVVAHMVQCLDRVDAALREGQTRAVKAATRAGTGAATG
jgi:hypothetical protein